MAQRIKLDMERIEAHYRIDEDGAVWSYRMGRYIKPTCCGGYYDYYYVSLHDAGIGMVSVHKLVASKFLGDCPDGKEISHKDGNKWNNHWTNLEYLTHTENIYKSFAEHGRVAPAGNHHYPSWETKQLMSAAKKKKVVSSDGEVWSSLTECATALGYTRVGLYYSMKQGKVLKNGLRLQFVTP
jgi:hypothetical protein